MAPTPAATATPNINPNQVTSPPTTLELAALTISCWEKTYERMNLRISQLWKARFTVWTMSFAGGLVFQQHSPQNYSPESKLLILFSVIIVIYIILRQHLQFEWWQENRIARERKIIGEYANMTHSLLIESLKAHGAASNSLSIRFQALKDSPMHYIADVPNQHLSPTRQMMARAFLKFFGLPNQPLLGVAGLRLWIISIALAIAMVVIVAIKLYNK